MQLDSTLNLIEAWDTTSTTMTFHGQNYNSFTQYISSDGTCSESPSIDSACTQTLTGLGTITTYYDS